MRVLVVGASGAIGTRLIPQLTDRGHEVAGSSRSAGKAGRLRALGAEPMVLDVLDARAVRDAVTAARPDAIIYQATALANATFGRSLDRAFAPTNRLRTQSRGAYNAKAKKELGWTLRYPSWRQGFSCLRPAPAAQGRGLTAAEPTP
jgi:dTDP-4-dehydrorhamnose reductase